MEWMAKWIIPSIESQDICPIFGTEFQIVKEVKQAQLSITALGVYEAVLNGSRVGDFILAPGWTSYRHRLQYQQYDVTDQLKNDNQLTVLVGKGWYRSPMPGWTGSDYQNELRTNPPSVLAQLSIHYTDGSHTILGSDETWTVWDSSILFSEIYDGETCDATFLDTVPKPVKLYKGPFHTLIPQQGEAIQEQERLTPARIFTTPAGETVIDFGQEITGYVEVTVDARAGDEILISHGEVLDQCGNFYTANYRSAKAKLCYICRDGQQTYKPKLTFFGFRYIRLDRFPGGPSAVRADHVTAVVIHSAMKRTGTLRSSDPLLNRLFDNIIWGQRGNFVDVPTDCPQRDERLGWTGDAQVFIRTACLNYDVEKFFTKWLADMAADQGADGRIGHVIPDLLEAPEGSAAWADAAAICPWELYLAYGSPQILAAQYDCMKKWVGYITNTTKNAGLWTGGTHFGDWLGLDAPSGSYKGSSREDFIASAFYAYSTSLVIKAGRVLGEPVEAYEALYQSIVATFQAAYPDYHTQTECILAAHFHLAPDCQAAADQLAHMVRDCGTQLMTGFVGTPYLLHVLSDYGYTELAYDLLLRTEYPSWLYPVTKGATTIWEHWDGIMENGDFWSDDMNSYNHYAYGAVADWVYGTAAGITPVESAPGYEKVRIHPHPDKRLSWLEATLETRKGLIRSCWKKEGLNWRYEIETPVDAQIILGDQEYWVEKGRYLFYSGDAS